MDLGNAKTRSRLKVIVILLTLTGLVASLLSFLVYVSGNSGYCISNVVKNNGLPAITSIKNGESGGCEKLYSMPQAKVLGLHFSVLAPAYFALITALTILWLTKEKKVFETVLIVLYAVGVALVPYLIYLEHQAKTLCPYCTAMHCVILSNLALIAYIAYKRR